MPYTLKQSPRFGVSSTSTNSSLKNSYSFKALPSFSSPILPSSTIMPSLIFAKPSSVLEQIIPSLSTPRSFAFLMLTPFGKLAPTRATATNCPAATFFAPQTICKGSFSPTSTLQRLNLSAFSTLPFSLTSPTTTLSGTLKG